MIQTPKLNLTTTNPSAPGWHRETSFLVDYPPAVGDAVAVIGAYSGTIAGLLIEQAPQAKHFLIEPQDWACRQLRQRFGHLANVHVCEHGVGDRSGRFTMGLYTSYDCSFVRGRIPLKDIPGTFYEAQLVEFGEWMDRERLTEIHYASINIEGYEFVLLPYLAAGGWLERIKCIGISWHDTRFNCPVPGPYTWQGCTVPSFETVQGELPKTHELVLDIDNWQIWVRRGT